MNLGWLTDLGHGRALTDHAVHLLPSVARLANGHSRPGSFSCGARAARASSGRDCIREASMDARLAAGPRRVYGASWSVAAAAVGSGAARRGGGRQRDASGWLPTAHVGSAGGRQPRPILTPGRPAASRLERLGLRGHRRGQLDDHPHRRERRRCRQPPRRRPLLANVELRLAVDAAAAHPAAPNPTRGASTRAASRASATTTAGASATATAAAVALALALAARLAAQLPDVVEAVERRRQPLRELLKPARSPTPGHTPHATRATAVGTHQPTVRTDGGAARSHRPAPATSAAAAAAACARA